MATNDGTSLYYPSYFCGASSGTKYFYNYKSARLSLLCTLAVFCELLCAVCCGRLLCISAGVLAASSAVVTVGLLAGCGWFYNSDGYWCQGTWNGDQFSQQCAPPRCTCWASVNLTLSSRHLVTKVFCPAKFELARLS